jgi:hypothetical protein
MEHVFKRAHEVTACSHTDIDGVTITEALVSMPDGAEDGTFGMDVVVTVRHHNWVRESIRRAAGGPGTTSGMLAIYAIQAAIDDEELHILAHPHAPSPTYVLGQAARCLERGEHDC